MGDPQLRTGGICVDQGEGLGNPPFFVAALPYRPSSPCVWGLLTKKPANTAGQVMGLFNVTTTSIEGSVSFFINVADLVATYGPFVRVFARHN